MRILCLHGVGLHDEELGWREDWEKTIRASLRSKDNPELGDDEIQFEFSLYDELFRQHPITAGEIAEALGKLIGSGVVHGISDLFRRERGSPTGRKNLVRLMKDKLRWTAGMVVQWAENDVLRRELRDFLANEIEEHDPEVIVAHSLGSLAAYDLLMHRPQLGRGRHLVTLGSQIGNPFVRSALGGRISMPDVRTWHHLFNRSDDVFTARVRLDGPQSRFEEIDTWFDLEGFGDHEAVEYLGHDNAKVSVWGAIAARGKSAPARRALSEFVAKPSRRALLIGINQYAGAVADLEGCVNDVFEVSATLQESGFRPEEIRTIFNERATAAAIRERLEWLLEGAQADDERFLYFSGHGAQMAGYGSKEEIDRLDEVLVAYDFDWTTERAITDDDLHELYSQLPYGARFMAVLDCCHSGGMTRMGAAKVRGLTAPDDVRHRALEWDASDGMWVPRSFNAGAPEGERGLTGRLGRAMPLRRQEDGKVHEVRRKLGHMGPYMPLIIQACGEAEFSYEYRHGVTSYGAFTYAFTSILRRHRHRNEKPTWEEMVVEVRELLDKLGYQQTPQIRGPVDFKTAQIPWTGVNNKAAKTARKQLAELTAMDVEELTEAQALKVQERIEEILSLHPTLAEEGTSVRRADDESTMRHTLSERWRLGWNLVEQPRNIEDMVDLIERALKQRASVRAVGAARSISDVSNPSPITDRQMWPVSLLRASRQVPFKDKQDKHGWQLPQRTNRYRVPLDDQGKPKRPDTLYRCMAGRSAHAVIGDLRRSGRALANHGSGSFQGIVGALATGTHGSGATLPPLSGLVRAITIVAPQKDGSAQVQLIMPRVNKPFDYNNGDVIDFSFESDLKVHVVVSDDTFHATTIGLGCLGLVYSLTMQVMPTKARLAEMRSLYSWNELSADKGALLQKMVREVERFEVQIIPQHGRGFLPTDRHSKSNKDGSNGREIQAKEHLCQVVEREPEGKRTDWPEKSQLIRHPLLIAGSLPVAKGIIGNRIRACLQDPSKLDKGVVMSLSGIANPTKPYRGYLADVLLLELKYNGVGAEFAVPLAQTIAATDDILKIAQGADDRGRGIMQRLTDGEISAAKAHKELVKLWREDPPFTAVLTLRFIAEDDALLAMSSSPDSRRAERKPENCWCVFEIGMLGAPKFDAHMRNGTKPLTAKAKKTYELYQAYQEGIPKQLNRLQTHLTQTYGARPHWGLFNSIDQGLARARWGEKWDSWIERYEEVNLQGIFNNAYTEQLGISVPTGGPHFTGKVHLRPAKAGAGGANGISYLKLKGALGRFLFESLGLPQATIDGGKRRGVHLLGSTDNVFDPFVCEISFDEKGALRRLAPGEWNLYHGPRTRLPGTGVLDGDTLHIDGPAGRKLAAILHLRGNHQGAAPETTKLDVLNLRGGEFSR